MDFVRTSVGVVQASLFVFGWAKLTAFQFFVTDSLTADGIDWDCKPDRPKLFLSQHVHLILIHNALLFI